MIALEIAMDAEIERATGKSIPELWREEGEAAETAAPAEVSPTTARKPKKFWSAASTSRLSTKSWSKKACSAGKNSS